MILAYDKIKESIENGDLEISEFNEKCLNPNSYDLTLANKIAWFPVLENFTTVPLVDEDTTYEKYGMAAVSDPGSSSFMTSIGYLDPAKDNIMIEKTIPKEGVILLPHILYLAMVNEEIFSTKYVTELSGKSTLARLGVIVHHTAGYSNLGHRFKYVLEIQVVHPIRIYPNMRIAQVYFHTTTSITTENNQYLGNYTNDQQNTHISSPKPIKGFEDVVNIPACAESVAVSHEDLVNYMRLKNANDLTVDESGVVHSDVAKNTLERVIPHVSLNDVGDKVVSSFEFPGNVTEDGTLEIDLSKATILP